MVIYKRGTHHQDKIWENYQEARETCIPINHMNAYPDDMSGAMKMLYKKYFFGENKGNKHMTFAQPPDHLT